jgi:cbb3-type cytochrome oxidase maturation protein
VSFLIVTIPVSLLVSATLLFLVIRAARAGEFDDWEGPAARMLFDDDRAPELEDAPAQEEREAEEDRA